MPEAHCSTKRVILVEVVSCGQKNFIDVTCLPPTSQGSLKPHCSVAVVRWCVAWCVALLYSRLQYMTRIHECTLGKIIPEVCEAIYECLGKEYLKTPSTMTNLKIDVSLKAKSNILT